MSVPLVQEINYQNPYHVFSYFKERTESIFLDSAELRLQCGRYSFIAIDPFQVMRSKNGVLTINDRVLCANPFEVLEQALQKFSLETLRGLPPFQGGVAGYWGYELIQHLERIPLAVHDDMAFPDLVLGFYDTVLAFDQVKQKAWIFSSGFPVQNENKRQRRARERLQAILEELNHLPQVRLDVDTAQCCAGLIAWQMSFLPRDYQAVVQKTIDYILAGDIFEANLSQRFKTAMPQAISTFEIYTCLRNINPAPFMAYLNFSDIILVSASPERFIKLYAGQVETRPIKGTCARGKTRKEDEQHALALLASEKDRSENIMIVDLLRNDLSRVCEDNSVAVLKLCGLESYATVHHLVSVITGQLQKKFTAIDLLKVTFPGGSVTGAPKYRAMEIIAELEPTQRGPYCGSIGYIGFDGQMDSSMTIRTFCIKDQIITFQAGGAVVADSCPQQEYEEVLIKAKALFRVLGGYENDSAY